MQDEEEQTKEMQDLNLEHATRAHDLNRQTSANHTKAAIESANFAIRSLILVNGGAVVALLAFLGALESGDSGNALKVDALIVPLLSFGLGVAFSAVTVTLAYLVNMLDSDITNSVHLTWEHPYVEEDEKAPRLKWWRVRLHIAAIIFALASLMSFFVGIITVATAMSELGI